MFELLLALMIGAVLGYIAGLLSAPKPSHLVENRFIVRAPQLTQEQVRRVAEKAAARWYGRG